MPSTRKIHRVMISKPTLEGAGVHLRRGFDFHETHLTTPPLPIKPQLLMFMRAAASSGVKQILLLTSRKASVILTPAAMPCRATTP